MRLILVIAFSTFLTFAARAELTAQSLVGRSFTWARTCALDFGGPFVPCKSTISFQGAGQVSFLDIPGDPDDPDKGPRVGAYRIENDKILVSLDRFHYEYSLGADGHSLLEGNIVYPENPRPDVNAL